MQTITVGLAYPTSAFYEFEKFYLETKIPPFGKRFVRFSIFVIVLQVCGLKILQEIVKVCSGSTEIQTREDFIAPSDPPNTFVQDSFSRLYFFHIIGFIQ